MEDRLRQRSKKRLLRVTMPNGHIICHKNVTATFVETLSQIDTRLYEQVKLENAHKPLISQSAEGPEEYHKPLTDGWYVNVMSDSDMKYRQLSLISKQFDLGIIVEIGTDFATSDHKVSQKKSIRRDKKLIVTYPNGEKFAGGRPQDTLKEVIAYIGAEIIQRKGICYKNKPIITMMEKYIGQIQLGKHMWLTIPATTKDKFIMLKTINLQMRLNFNVSLV